MKKPFLVQLHNSFIRNSLLRKYQRRLSRLLKNQAGVPDAYGDMFTLIRRHSLNHVLDIGSFQGQTVDRFLDEVSAEIHAFEPTPDSFRFLQNKYKENPKVHLTNSAVGDQPGKISFFMNENPQTNSLLDNDSGNEISFLEDTRHVTKIEADVITLDNWVNEHLSGEQIFIKCDVQGAEGKLMDGGETVLRNQTVALYGEVLLSPLYEGQKSFTELNDKMMEYGFVIGNIYPCMHDTNGRAVQTDVLWIKEEYLSV